MRKQKRSKVKSMKEKVSRSIEKDIEKCKQSLQIRGEKYFKSKIP